MSKKAPDRKYFTKIYPIDPPDLIEIQKNSYYWFLKEGLGELFEEISPIIDVSEKGLELHFDDYYLDEPKFDEVTSKSKNITYEAPIRIKATLKNTKTKQKETQEIFLGDFPLITDRGTFIINGIERAFVSQIIRSAGVFFTSSYVREKNRRFYGAKIIPNRGAWLEIETDANNVIWVKIDRKRKVAITSLLRAFGVATNEEILNYFKDVDNHEDIRFIESTLAKDISTTVEDGLIEVYKRIRPGDLATPDNARSLIYSMFFNFSRYDFGKVGRYKMNQRFGTDYKLDDKDRVLKIEDVVNVIKEIIKLNITQEDADDIDHLGNRRIRAVGELIQNRFRVGLARMERIIKDRMSTLDITALTPSKLINARPVNSAVKEFFMSSQLSQFMDQVNPLAELEHKRRLSATGPGGLSRERAGFEVRDVHPTHYGRICPIESPEGPNIGLVSYLSSYARINDYGFILSPYFVVEQKASKAKVTNKIVYLDASEEDNAIIAPASIRTDKDGYILGEKTAVRK